MTTHRIGIAEFVTAKAPDKIRTNGLGSCVAIVLYDTHTKIGGMVHVMLPTLLKKISEHTPAKFADTGIVTLLEEMIKLGVKKERVVAKITGGANMFPLIEKSTIQIGNRNIEKTKEVLVALGIPIALEETGGTKGRNVEFDLETGVIMIQILEGRIERK